jgi:TPP-dependent pyruvate/acetoin dehydrogenase alpha subunit
VGGGSETEQRLSEIRDETAGVVDAAVEFARAAELPGIEEAYEHVYRD